MFDNSAKDIKEAIYLPVLKPDKTAQSETYRKCSAFKHDTINDIASPNTDPVYTPIWLVHRMLEMTLKMMRLIREANPIAVGI